MAPVVVAESKERSGKLVAVEPGSLGMRGGLD
jgi:hypothetical protein